MTTVTTASPEETSALGRSLAARLLPPSTVALHGELGAGKTCFTRGIVEGWGGMETATSPTFTLVHEYTTPRGPVFHFDLYRAKSAEEIWSAAHDELEAPHGLVILEWADRFPEIIPANATYVAITDIGNGQRRITITP